MGIRNATHPPEYYINGIKNNDRVILSQAITMVESSLASHRIIADQILEGCNLPSSNSMRIGVTGSPGVGKSTLIEALGLSIIEEGHRPAILAIDPSSKVSGGSILGDKTRMQNLSVHPDAYVRPSAAGNELGGVGAQTKEIMLLCEAAGYNVIIIETVGVGQSEVEVHSMVDYLLLLLLPGAGDELQGIKRGIVEMADGFAVNKADLQGNNGAKLTKTAYQNALHLFPQKESGWTPKIELISALEGMGIEQLWKTILSYFTHIKDSGFYQQNRLNQRKEWFDRIINHRLRQLLHQQLNDNDAYAKICKQVSEGELVPSAGARKVVELFT